MAAVVTPGISAPVQFSSAAPELPHRCLGSPRTGSGCTDIRVTFSKRSWTRSDSQEPVTAWPTGCSSARRRAEARNLCLATQGTSDQRQAGQHEGPRSGLGSGSVGSHVAREGSAGGGGLDISNGNVGKLDRITAVQELVSGVVIPHLDEDTRTREEIVASGRIAARWVEGDEQEVEGRTVRHAEVGRKDHRRRGEVEVKVVGWSTAARRECSAAREKFIQIAIGKAVLVDTGRQGREKERLNVPRSQSDDIAGRVSGQSTSSGL